MELLETILVTFIIGNATSALWACIQFLLHLLVNVSIISEKMQVSALDRYLAKYGWCSSRAFDFSGMPAFGIHILLMRTGCMPTGFIVAYKHTDSDMKYNKQTQYTIYWLGRGAAVVREHVIGNPEAITLRNIYVPSPWRTSVDINYVMPPESMRPWQKLVVKQIISMYATTGKASFLVCGWSGCGKSTLGELVALQLKGIGVIPEVVKNADLTTANLLLNDLYDTPTVSTPIILMLDEFDVAIKYAQRDTKNDKSEREAICLANTPTLLLSTMDQLARTKNLIVIATSNMKLSELRNGSYERYTRRGRIDGYFQVVAK